MARADGVVSEEEFAIFCQAFGVPAEEESNIRRIFNLARQDVAGFEYYAGQIAQLFVGNPAMLEEISRNTRAWTLEHKDRGHIGDVVIEETLREHAKGRSSLRRKLT